MTHNREEMINDLKAIEAGFMEESGGSSPVCLSYAVAAIKQLTAYEKAIDEIKKMPISGEYALGVCDCLEIIAKHLSEATGAQNENDKT